MVWLPLSSKSILMTCDGAGLYSLFWRAIKCWINAHTLGIFATTKLPSFRTLILSGEPDNFIVFTFTIDPSIKLRFRIAILFAFVSEA